MRNNYVLQNCVKKKQFSYLFYNYMKQYATLHKMFFSLFNASRKIVTFDFYAFPKINSPDHNENIS